MKTEKMFDFCEFIFSCGESYGYLTQKGENIRVGQHLMSELSKKHPKMYNDIVLGDHSHLDPFYDDSKLDSFFDWLREYPNVICQPKCKETNGIER